MIENNENISIIVKDDLCTGCGTCVSLCPENALEIELNKKKGIFRPKINLNYCNKCKICLKVCPGHEVDFKNLNQEIFGKQPTDNFAGNFLNSYIGYSNNNDIRYNSSSGGLITQLLIIALEEEIIDGALVTRMKKDDPLIPEPFIARTKEELIEASKSKYCPVPANIALKEILNSPKDEIFAVVGLPCHIHGIRKAERINKRLKEKIKLHIGILCGTTKNFNATKYQLREMGIEKEMIIKLDYRGKGWPGYLTVNLINEKKICEEYTKYYAGNFSSFIPWRCTMCFDHDCELADISFGDAWLSRTKNEDNIGSSVIISRNKIGEDILTVLSDNKIIDINEINDLELAEMRKKYYFKKIGINSRFSIAKLIGKKIPVYTNQILLNQSISNYFVASYLYTWMYISSKKSLWFFFNVKKFIGKIYTSVRSSA